MGYNPIEPQSDEDFKKIQNNVLPIIKLDGKKLVDYLNNEINNPRCVSSKCVCLNLIQKIKYGDFNE
jgi:hypothetical protein